MQKGMSPLCTASEKDHVEVAKVLLEYGPQVNLPNNVRTMLQYRFSYWTSRPLQVVIQFIVHRLHLLKLNLAIVSVFV